MHYILLLNTCIPIRLCFVNKSVLYKTKISSATGRADGDDLEVMVATYDYIIAKYGSSKYVNFMNRSVISLASPFAGNINIENNAFVTVICVIGLLSITAIGYIVLRKKHI